MVGPAGRLVRFLANAVRRDLARFIAVVPNVRARPGLYRYVFHPSNGRRVVHLRLAADRSAVLLLDASDVVHLNATAAALAKAALDGIPQTTALAPLQARCSAADQSALQQGADAIYRTISQIATSGQLCPTCDLDNLGRAPLFSRPVHAPLKADLALTYACNNACHHCYNEPGRKRGQVMPPDRWQTVLEIIATIGVPHVIFTGGEPTLYNGLELLVETACRLRLVTGMNTNGRRLAHGRLAADLQQAGLDHIQITLGSHHAALHNATVMADAFDETVEGIDRCLEAGLHTVTNTTLTRRNAVSAVDTLDFLHARGVRCCAFNAMIHAGKGRAHPDTLLSNELAPLLLALRDRAAELGVRMLWYTPTRYCELSPLELELGVKRCNAAEYSICVEPDGDVLPCQSYYQAAGNLLRDPWRGIWESELFCTIRDRVRNPRDCGLREACCDCPDLSVCAGGCMLKRGAKNLREPCSDPPCRELDHECAIGI